MKKTLFIAFFALILGPVTAQTTEKKWTLQECVQYALEHNITIKQSELDQQLAEIDHKSAVGNFLPSFNASARHSWNIGLNQNITTGILENQTIQFTSVGFNTGIDIYKGLQNQNRLRRSTLAELAAQYQLSKIKDDISLNVANAYLQILFNKESLKVQNQLLALDEQQLKRSEELVAAGSIPKGDLLDNQATVASDQQKVIVAENALLISRLSLAQLLQLEKIDDFDIADTDYPANQSSVMLQKPEDVYQKAKTFRIELKIAETNTKLAEKDVQIARGAYQPTLQGFYSFSTRASDANRITGAQLNTTNPTIESGSFVTVGGVTYPVMQPNVQYLFGKAEPMFDQFSLNKGHNFGIQMDIPIFNGFAARNAVAKSKVMLEKSKNTQKQSELDLQKTVYTVYTDAQGAFKSYQSADRALQSRQKAFDYARERYAVGLMNSFDFNQAQALYANAQSEALRTKYDFIFRTKIVELYFGIPIFK
ncbi:MAG: TolC family protein [Flavobacteriaceae bacterium]